MKPKIFVRLPLAEMLKTFVKDIESHGYLFCIGLVMGGFVMAMLINAMR